MGRESELRLEKTPGTFSCFRPRGRSGDAKRRPNVTIIGRGHESVKIRNGHMVALRLSAMLGWMKPAHPASMRLRITPLPR